MPLLYGSDSNVLERVRLGGLFNGERAMPRFYCHLRYPENEIQDAEGIDMVDLAAAEREAKGAIREIAAENLRGDVRFSLLGIHITDHAGNLLSAIESQAVLEDAISGKVLAAMKHSLPRHAEGALGVANQA